MIMILVIVEFGRTTKRKRPTRMLVAWRLKHVYVGCSSHNKCRIETVHRIVDNGKDVIAREAQTLYSEWTRRRLENGDERATLLLSPFSSEEQQWAEHVIPQISIIFWRNICPYEVSVVRTGNNNSNKHHMVRIIVLFKCKKISAEVRRSKAFARHFFQMFQSFFSWEDKSQFFFGGQAIGGWWDNESR